MNIRKLIPVAALLCSLGAYAEVPAKPSTVPASEEDSASVDVAAIRAAAEAGDAAAQVRYGEILNDGKQVPADEAGAVKWFQRAAEQGNADGQFNLGLMYIRGAGVPKDDVEAYKWLMIAGEGGRADALSVRDGMAWRMKPEQLDRARALARSWKPARKK